MAPRNLAEALGIDNPDPKAAKPDAAAEVPDLGARQFARTVLNSNQYRESVLRRILMNELPPAVETKLMDYAWGRPVERIEVEDKTTSYEEWSTDRLMARIQKLHAILDRLRDKDATEASSPSSPADEDGAPPMPRVH
jgi:hypothetical protein